MINKTEKLETTRDEEMRLFEGSTDENTVYSLLHFEILQRGKTERERERERREGKVLLESIFEKLTLPQAREDFDYTPGENEASVFLFS